MVMWDGAGILVCVFCLPLPSLYISLVSRNFITRILCSDCMSFGVDRTNKLAYDHESVHVINKGLCTKKEWQKQLLYICTSEATEPAAADVRLPDHHTPSPNQRGQLQYSILSRRMSR